MGVPGLWETISPGFEKRKPFEVLVAEHLKTCNRPLKLAIDAFGWLVEVYKNQRMSHLETSVFIDVCANNFFNRVKSLLKLGVSFILVFDGKFKSEMKRNFSEDIFGTGIKSHTDKDYFSEYFKFVKSLHNNPSLDLEDEYDYITSFQKIFDKVKTRLQVWNISYLISPSEGEAECAYLQKLGIVDYVMTNDVDAFIFGATKVLRNYSKFVEDKPSSFQSDHEDSNFWVTPVLLDRVERITGFNKWRMLLFAILNGSDYSPGMVKMGTRRAALVSLIGTSKFVLHDPNEKQQSKRTKNCTDDFTEARSKKSTAVMDFAKKLEFFYTSPYDYSFETRMKYLKRFQESLKNMLMDRSFDIFGQNLDKNTFLKENGDLDGFDNDYVILLFLFPKINLSNIFRFSFKMLNYSELDYNDRIEFHAFDFNLVWSALDLQTSSSKQVSVRRISGFHFELPYILDECCFNFDSNTLNWSLDDKLKVVKTKKATNDDFMLNLDLDSNDTKDYLSLKLNIDKFVQRFKNYSSRSIQNVIKDFDTCFTYHFFSFSNLEKGAMLIDKSKMVEYPNKRNFDYATERAMIYSGELLRIAYNPHSLLEKVLVDNSIVQSSGVLDQCVCSDSKQEPSSAKNNSPGDEPKTKFSSVWVLKEVLNYYAGSKVQEYSTSNRSAAQSRTASRKNSRSQKTKIDSFSMFKPTGPARQELKRALSNPIKSKPKSLKRSRKNLDKRSNSTSCLSITDFFKSEKHIRNSVKRASTLASAEKRSTLSMTNLTPINGGDTLTSDNEAEPSTSILDLLGDPSVNEDFVDRLDSLAEQSLILIDPTEGISGVASFTDEPLDSFIVDEKCTSASPITTKTEYGESASDGFSSDSADFEELMGRLSQVKSEEADLKLGSARSVKREQDN